MELSALTAVSPVDGAMEVKRLRYAISLVSTDSLSTVLSLKSAGYRSYLKHPVSRKSLPSVRKPMIF